MASNQELVDKIAELRAGQTESRQDAAAARAVAEQVVGLLQALTAKIGELAAGGVQLVTQEQLNALVAQADAGIADMNAANAERDAAAAALAQAVTDNTPAVIPEPLPANPPV